MGFSPHILTVPHSVQLGHFRFGAKNLGAEKWSMGLIEFFVHIATMPHSGHFGHFNLGTQIWPSPTFAITCHVSLVNTLFWGKLRGRYWSRFLGMPRNRFDTSLARAGASSISSSKDPMALLWRTSRRGKMARKLETGGPREEDLTQIIYGPCVALSDIRRWGVRHWHESKTYHLLLYVLKLVRSLQSLGTLE